MKKKILSFFVFLSIILVGALTLTACKDTDTNIYVNSADTLSSAIVNAKENDVIVLENDIDINAQLNVTQKITLDLNGHKLFNTSDIWSETNSTWSLISVKANGDLTITGNGTLDAKENDCYALDIREGGVCTIKNSTFVGNVSAIYVHTGNLTIENGTFNIKQLSQYSDYRYELNCLDANLKNAIATITIKGGSFYNYDPSNSNSENPIENFLADGYTATVNSDNYFVVSNA